VNPIETEVQLLQLGHRGDSVQFFDKVVREVETLAVRHLFDHKIVLSVVVEDADLLVSQDQSLNLIE